MTRHDSPWEGMRDDGLFSLYTTSCSFLVLFLASFVNNYFLSFVYLTSVSSADKGFSWATTCMPNVQSKCRSKGLLSSWLSSMASHTLAHHAYYPSSNRPTPPMFLLRRCFLLSRFGSIRLPCRRWDIYFFLSAHKIHVNASSSSKREDTRRTPTQPRQARHHHRHRHQPSYPRPTTTHASSASPSPHPPHPS